MRKLTDSERSYFLQWADESIRMSKIVANIFRVFGGFQIGGIVIGILCGAIQGVDIVFALAGAAILAVFYFGIPALIISQNTYKKMKKIVEKEKEIAYDGFLTELHRCHHGKGSSETKGKVRCTFDNKIKICHISDNLKSSLQLGEPVVILCFNIAATGEMFAIKADTSALKEEE